MTELKRRVVTPLGPRLLSVREVATRLGLHTNTVKRIPRSRRGDRRYHPVDVADYLERNG